MLAEAIRSSKTLAEAMRKLGLKPTGNRYTKLKQQIQQERIDTSHLLGKGWNVTGEGSRATIRTRHEPRTKYSKKVLEAAVRDSRSIAQVLQKLGIRPAGGSHSHIRRRLTQYGIDTSHFLGKGWNVGGQQSASHRRRTAQQILVLAEEKERFEPARYLKRALLEIGRNYHCEVCGLGEQWHGRPLVLQIDHINGLRHDNRPENLRFLCPNCHSQTQNYNRPHS